MMRVNRVRHLARGSQTEERLGGAEFGGFSHPCGKCAPSLSGRREEEMGVGRPALRQ